MESRAKIINLEDKGGEISLVSSQPMDTGSDRKRRRMGEGKQVKALPTLQAA